MRFLRCMLMVALFCGVANTQTTTLMNYQGQLFVTGGSPANGTHSISFALYNTPSGGSPSWSETQSVNVSNGSFSVLLGSVTPLPDSIMTADYALYLGTTVGVDPEMSPRTRLVSVPSAARVRSIEGARGGTIDQGIFMGADSTSPDSVGLSSAEAESHSRAPIPCTDLSKRVLLQLGNTIGTKHGLLTLSNGANTTISLQGCSGNLSLTGKATIGYNSLNLGSGNFIAGGWSSIQGDSSTICGGNTNMIVTNYGVLSGGLHNRVNGMFGFIGGGELNKVDGLHGTVPGGRSNIATGAFSFAAGSSATALGDRSFVWNGKATPFSSTAAPGQFLINCDNVGINTSSPARLLDVNGSLRTNSFEMPTGASNGFVLTSNASGVGTWQAAGGGTANGWVDDGTNVRLQTVTDNVGIGTVNPGAKLDVAGDITNSTSDIVSLKSTGSNTGTGRAYGGSFIATGAGGTDIHSGLSSGGSGSTTDNRGIMAFGDGTSGQAYGLTAVGSLNSGNGGATGVYCAGQNIGTGGSFGIYATAAAMSGDAIGARLQAYRPGGSGTSYGIWTQATASGGPNYGIFSWASGGTTNYAGYFSGDVTVSGTLSKGGGAFKIDHPLDPENKYLQHSFVESPDMMNIYNGNVTTDANGTAVVNLPDYFEALNRDFRYQLTVIGQFAQAIIATEISGGAFVVKTDKPNVKVSWQVTGVRKDVWAEKNRIQVEVDKKPDEKGKYIYPELFGAAPSSGIEYERQQTVRDTTVSAGLKSTPQQ